VLVRPLLRHLARHAPGIDIAFRTARGQLSRLLEHGGRGCGIGMFDADLGDSYRQELFRDDFVCLMRAGHPAARRPPHPGALPRVPPCARRAPELDDIRGWWTPGSTRSERSGASSSPSRISSWPPTPSRTSDLLLTIATRMARVIEKPFGLHASAPPLELPEFTINQYWHEQRHQDPSHIWLRDLLRRLCQEELDLTGESDLLVSQ
jgi:DNA-binding transcriptional LysR family regulator